MEEIKFYGGESESAKIKFLKLFNKTQPGNSSEIVGNKPPIIESFEDILKNDKPIKKAYNEITGKLGNITKNYKKLKANSIYANKIDKEEEILKSFVDNNGTNLFEKLISDYNKDYNESTEEIAKINLYDNIVLNDLDPEKELAITFADKVIFIVIVVAVRFMAIYITYYYIDANIVTNISRALFYYAAAYLIVFFIITIVVNADVFRLRMLFNYLNFHVNLAGVFTHFIIFIIVIYLVYLLILNMMEESTRKTLSSNEKRKLKYKLDMLTITVLIFMIVFVLVL
jgi:hypothetical protein